MKQHNYLSGGGGSRKHKTLRYKIGMWLVNLIIQSISCLTDVRTLLQSNFLSIYLLAFFSFRAFSLRKDLLLDLIHLMDDKKTSLRD